MANSTNSWQPSHRDFVKINFDGSSRGNPSDSGVGVCIRDYMGDLKAFKSSILPPGTNNVVEVQALLEGLILAKKLDFLKVHVEVDSSLIINAYI